uniref:Uncharacterized protein n=1 Tax=Anguilla anguilla TaxID=7936 RepID=A0A0E9WY14_ANGAN
MVVLLSCQEVLLHGLHTVSLDKWTIHLTSVVILLGRWTSFVICCRGTQPCFVNRWLKKMRLLTGDGNNGLQPPPLPTISHFLLPCDPHLCIQQRI